MDALISTETVDGGKLREAATRKSDESLLIHIADKDLVALEVKYHKRCYEKYTLFLRHSTGSQTKEQHECKYEKSFDVFCEEFVRIQMIKEENVFYMKRLTKEFVKTVARVENTDASNYRTFRLKERLCERFPQLVFHTPTVRNKSEIVYVECLSQGRVAESDQELEAEVVDEDVVDEGASPDYTGATLKDMYTVGLTFKNILRGLTSDWYESWPPLASDFPAENVKKLVSPLLFKFIAWFLGFSDEPEDADYLKLDEKTTAMIFSLCQDLVYAAKVQTPKSLALAMTVRQMTGCSGLTM